MKILFWVELFPPDTASGGAEASCLALIQGLRALGVECAVITSRSLSAPQDYDEYKGIPVYRFPFHGVLLSRDLARIVALQQRVKALKMNFQPDILHINTSQGSLYFHQRTRADAACPTLLTIREALQAESENSLIGREITGADWLTTPSEAMRAEIIRALPQAANRLTCVPNGLPMPNISPEKPSVDPPRVLCLGRLVKDKGFDLAISAFATVLRQLPAARLIIAGDGPARAELMAQANALQIAAAIDFIGYVQPDAVPALINSATIVVVPSRVFEVFGLVAVEAGQMARPVVAANRGGLAEVVAHGETGLLVEPENSPALAAAILQLLKRPLDAAKMGQAGYQRVMKQYSQERLVADYLAIYSALAS